MKKSRLLVLFVVVFVTSIGFAGFTSASPRIVISQDETATEVPTPTELPPDAPRAASIHNASVTASLYDKTHADALTAMGIEFGFRTSHADSVEFAQTADVARNLAADGTELVVFTSGGQASVLLEVAPEFPDTWFALISSASALPDSGNASAWDIDYFEAGFLVGVVAALQTDTGYVGCIGGSAIPPIVANCSGVIEGAAYIDPDIVVEVGMVGNFTDIAAATELANAMIGRGVDVLFAPAGGAAQGVIQAADEAGISAIGYVADENFRAPETVITSQIIDYKQAYHDLGELFTSGELEPEIYPMTIAGGHIHYGPFAGRVKDGVEERAMEIFDMIYAGELELERVIHDEITS